MKKNKKKRLEKKYLIILFLLICIIGLIVRPKEIYKIEDRTKNIKKEQKTESEKIKTIGWVKVQGTNIDAPVITYTEMFDARRDTEEKKNFAYNLEKEEKLYNKVNIMGHNILNLSKHPRLKDKRFTRFDELMSFVYIDFAKKNKYIQYTINGENYLYKIYSVRLYDSYKKVETEIKKPYTENEIIKYANTVRKDSLYKYKVKISGKDNLLSLITCTRFFGAGTESSFVVDARMLRKGEKVTNYPVEETDNYKKILKIMKGDGKDEV